MDDGRINSSPRMMSCHQLFRSDNVIAICTHIYSTTLDSESDSVLNLIPMPILNLILRILRIRIGIKLRTDSESDSKFNSVDIINRE